MAFYGCFLVEYFTQKSASLNSRRLETGSLFSSAINYVTSNVAQAEMSEYDYGNNISFISCLYTSICDINTNILADSEHSNLLDRRSLSVVASVFLNRLRIYVPFTYLLNSAIDTMIW